MEKRDTVRAKKRVMVRYGREKADKTAFTKDISETGVRLQTNNVVAPGITIRIELKFPDRKFSMWGRVAWAKKVPPQLAHILDCGMGVAFVDPPEDWKPFFETWRGGRNA